MHRDERTNEYGEYKYIEMVNRKRIKSNVMADTETPGRHCGLMA